MTEENYFFRLSVLAPAVASWLGASPSPVRPATRRNEAFAWLRAGLTDISISRTSLDWGIPLPWDRKHVAYVWLSGRGAGRRGRTIAVPPRSLSPGAPGFRSYTD